MELFLGPLFCDIGLYFKLCASTTDFITITLKYDLNSGAVIPPAYIYIYICRIYIFLLMAGLAIHRLWYFKMDFRVNIYFHKIRIVMRISLTLEVTFRRTQIFRVFILTI